MKAPIILQPSHIIRLSHPAYFLRAASAQKIAIAATRDGQITTWKLGTATTVSPGVTIDAEKMRAISLHPTKPLLAFVDGSGTLRIQRLDGAQLFKTELPPLDGAPEWFVGGFHDCLFDDTVEHLWCTAPLSDKRIEIQLRAADDWSVVASAAIDDPYGQSESCVFPAGRACAAVLWVNAQQNGRQVYWVRQSSNGLTCEDDNPNVQDAYWPVFSPVGDVFLTSTEYDGLSKYSCSKRRWGKSCRCPDRQDCFENSLCYLDETYALAGTFHGRVFLIDTKMMRVVQELILDGHEPKSDEGDANSIGKSWTDIRFFRKLGDEVVFVATSPDRQNPVDRPDDLVICAAPAILKQISGRA